MSTQTIETPTKVAMNGVDVPNLTATLGVVEGNRDLAKFTFRADGKWLSGTHSQATMAGYRGAGGDHERPRAHVIHGDHPAVLCGADNGATPVELLLAALSACITAGIGNIASIRQVKLHSVETTIEGDIDLQGIFGMDDTVRNGFSGIRARFRIAGDAPAEVLEKIVRQSVARSAVFDVLRNGVPVSVEAVAQ
ncbi:OsmC family protein [Chelativorans intermedius]|uniref:OsmC family protein n=1 Tax=Chelativorans intermedius TaxID=515947 RepID=A0ABV6D2L7_9HYPH|nr:OsmC family protein [Chelativorans intermedius]MCT8997299.1 OsmC family protein [Chelativorans intermedius]